MSNPLDSDIKFLPGIGPKRGGMLQKEFGISTFRDMLYFFPFRYTYTTGPHAAIHHFGYIFIFVVFRPEPVNYIPANQFRISQFRLASVACRT